MATAPQPHSHSNHDMRTHDETWRNFNRLARWVVIGAIILLAGMGLFLTGH